MFHINRRFRRGLVYVTVCQISFFVTVEPGAGSANTTTEGATGESRIPANDAQPQPTDVCRQTADGVNRSRGEIIESPSGVGVQLSRHCDLLVRLRLQSRGVLAVGAVV